MIDKKKLTALRDQLRQEVTHHSHVGAAAVSRALDEFIEENCREGTTDLGAVHIGDFLQKNGAGFVPIAMEGHLWFVPDAEQPKPPEKPAE